MQQFDGDLHGCVHDGRLFRSAQFGIHLIKYTTEHFGLLNFREARLKIDLNRSPISVAQLFLNSPGVSVLQVFQHHLTFTEFR